MGPTLLNRLDANGFNPDDAVLDKGYDASCIFEARSIGPSVPLRQTGSVKAWKDGPPTCEHGTSTFAGSDARRRASKWRCPTAECSPASVWVKADRLHSLVPRSTERWHDRYHERGAVEREFGYPEHGWSMLPLRVRRPLVFVFTKTSPS